jgi:hypothetical protein
MLPRSCCWSPWRRRWRSACRSVMAALAATWSSGCWPPGWAPERDRPPPGRPRPHHHRAHADPDRAGRRLPTGRRPQPAAWSTPAPRQGRHRQQQPDTDPVPGDQVAARMARLPVTWAVNRPPSPRSLITSALPATTLRRPQAATGGGSCRPTAPTAGSAGQCEVPGAAGCIVGAPCWSQLARTGARARGQQGQCLHAMTVQGSPGLLPSRCETSSMAANSSVAQVARTTNGWACW